MHLIIQQLTVHPLILQRIGCASFHVLGVQSWFVCFIRCTSSRFGKFVNSSWFASLPPYRSCATWSVRFSSSIVATRSEFHTKFSWPCNSLYCTSSWSHNTELSFWMLQSDSVFASKRLDDDLHCHRTIGPLCCVREPLLHIVLGFLRSERTFHLLARLLVISFPSVLFMLIVSMMEIELTCTAPLPLNAAKHILPETTTCLLQQSGAPRRVTTLIAVTPGATGHDNHLWGSGWRRRRRGSPWRSGAGYFPRSPGCRGRSAGQGASGQRRGRRRRRTGGSRKGDRRDQRERDMCNMAWRWQTQWT